jgi:replicative DNA helicase Mcm
MSAAGRDDLTERFIQFYGDYYHDEIGELAQQYPGEQRSLFIDYDDLYQFDADLAKDYRDKPEQMQEYAEEALRLYDLPVPVKLGQAHVRMTNLPNTTDIRGFRVHDEHIGRLVQVSGLIRKATDVRPKITHSAFECQRCGTFNEIPVQDGDYQEPHECSGCEREGPFEINFDQSEFVDAQKLRIQESPEGLRGGETPQSVDVNIEDDITGEVTPGDTVTVVGVLHIDQTEDGSVMFDTYLDGRSVTIEDEEFDEIDLQDSVIERIETLSDDPDLYTRMVESIAPTIFGFEEEKLAMVLQLFSGVTKHLPDGSRIRGDLHVLLIGDPGTGKSALLGYIRNVAPRSIFTSGKGASAAGLTASAVKDDFGEGNQWTLEAGAMVLADKGIAAVDELDKMDSSDVSAMHEGLEQQQISVSKAGINATLKSRCSLLAAANPKYGRFSKHESIPDQIELDPALISRFDLIFTVTDNPDQQHDSDLADHILNTNYAGELNAHQKQAAASAASKQKAADAVEEVAPEIESELLRKYIAFSRRTCFPAMTSDARSVLREFYIDLRGSGDDEVIPVTARKLEALVRLAEASARVRLSNTVQVKDAERAVDIVQSSLDEVGRDPETGEYDVDVIETGTSKTERDRIKNIKGLIDDIAAEQDDGGAPKEEVLDRAAEVGMDADKAERELDKLRREGEIYSPQSGGLKTTGE